MCVVGEPLEIAEFAAFLRGQVAGEAKGALINNIGEIRQDTRLLGAPLLGKAARMLHNKAGLPLWTPAMPQAAQPIRLAAPSADERPRVVYLAGGVTAHIPQFLHDGRFLQRYLNKGVMTEQLEQVPVWQVEHGQLGLLGAVAWYRQNRKA